MFLSRSLAAILAAGIAEGFQITLTLFRGKVEKGKIMRAAHAVAVLGLSFTLIQMAQAQDQDQENQNDTSTSSSSDGSSAGGSDSKSMRIEPQWTDQNQKALDTKIRKACADNPQSCARTPGGIFNVPVAAGVRD